MSVTNPVVRLELYKEKYRDAVLTRDGGILEVRFHTGGEPYRMNGRTHAEMPDLFWEIAADHENKVVILTGTGDRFSTECDADFDLSSGSAVAKVHWEGHRILRNLLDIEAPVIAAINGPLRMHCFPLVADIVLCTESTVFQDPHVINGTTAGDGTQIVWQYLIGPTRAKYYLMTGQVIDAQEALRLGVVNEVLSNDRLVSRAREMAKALCKQPQTALRYTRMAANAELRRLMLDLPMGYALQNLGTQTTTKGE
jgi:enoyl-CoA hydratase/carnithine racemase